MPPAQTEPLADMEMAPEDTAEIAPEDDRAVAEDAAPTPDPPADAAPVAGEDIVAQDTVVGVAPEVERESVRDSVLEGASEPRLEPLPRNIGALAELARAEVAGDDPASDVAPVAPAQDVMSSLVELPAIHRPEQPTERAPALAQMLPPPPDTPLASSVETDLPEPVAEDDAPQRSTLQPDRATMPGRPVTGLVRIDADPFVPGTGQDLPEAPEQPALTALERNSLHAGGDTERARMALVLNDPGLPMPFRRDLAALDFPFTIALNPLDNSAPAAAEIYTAGGKEVVILAAGLPVGATASDIDVSLTTYLEMFPTAVGMIDVPGEGFARNAALLRDILPYLARDGHGLITFAGGLSQASTAAQAAGVSHAEIFRVLDDGELSPFTIRRFLDRAVFQATQMGHVIVFGDAANETTLEAIAMWRDEGRVGQVALAPVSAILLAQD